MLQAVFQDRLAFLAGVVLMSLAGGGIAFFVAKRRGGGPWMYALWAAAVVAALSVTVFFPGGAGASRQCVINRNVAEPFATEQGLLNAAMYVPIGLFGVLATRRLVPVAVGGVLMSVGTELTQALAPWVGRNCDSSDIQMNGLGALAGAAAAWMATRAKGTSLQWERGAKQAGLVTLGAVLATGLALQTVISPIVVDATSLQGASSDEETAALKAVHAAFGDRYAISNVQLQPGIDQSRSTLLITFKTAGFAELSWPDEKHLNVSLESSSTPSSNSYAIDTGDGTAPADAEAAYRIAQKYAKKHYPWALKADHQETHPVGDNAEFGWITSWRWQSGGVLMPRSIDVQVNRAGRVSQLDVQEGPQKVDVPRRRVSKQQAEQAARHGAGGQAKATAITVRAVQRGGTWRAEWTVEVSISGSDPYLVFVDAETAKVHDAAPTV
ncbi:VanZ family protein [Streptomyces sp. NPDC002838]|uniref:VanZ family protein n=1 Tax=Streptomyces sp. NPDC002838 TaxID=3154436 RepID=UPI00331EC556